MDPEKEQIRLLSLINAWDALTTEQKWAEWSSQTRAEGSRQCESVYVEVPGFDPVYCHGCSNKVFLDFSNGPDGACPIDATHAIP